MMVTVMVVDSCKTNLIQKPMPLFKKKGGMNESTREKCSDR